MALFKLKSVPFILIEDDRDKNIIPLILELTQTGKSKLKLFCYEQPVFLWRNIFKDKIGTTTYNEFLPEHYTTYVEEKTSVVIDSVNQMALLLGWNQCLRYINSLKSHPNIVQLIIVLHKDCLLTMSKLQSHLNHIANAIISYDRKDGTEVSIQIKKSGKVVRTVEALSYDSKNSHLKTTPVISYKVEQSNESEQINPANLSTFKIEVAQIEKMEKNKLVLPYMSKINYGESKVHYEPDAVDDWDDEDPDDDLDI